MSTVLRRVLPFLLLCLCTLAVHAGSAADAEIDALIARVRQAQGVVFIRNGSDHTAPEAAAHLQRKREAVGDRFASAEQFIEAIGTRSSMTGRVYRVRTADGHEVDSATWLRGLLRELRAKAPPPAARGATSPAPAGR